MLAWSAPLELVWEVVCWALAGGSLAYLNWMSVHCSLTSFENCAMLRGL